MGHIERIQPCLQQIHNALADVPCRWLIGGSTGLMMQQIKLAAEPRDLDLYTDRKGIEAIHEALNPYAIDEPVDSETGIYRSLLSHYSISGVQVELVGGFEVDRGTAQYKVEVAELMFPYAPAYALDGFTFRIMPLVHELVFNVLRDRPDRYSAIAEVIGKDIHMHKGIWSRLLQRNRIGEPYLGTISALLPQLVQEEEG